MRRGCGTRIAGIEAAALYLSKHGYEIKFVKEGEGIQSSSVKVMPGQTAGIEPACDGAGYDIDAFGRAVCPRCFAFRGVRIGMRREGEYLECLACGLKTCAKGAP